MPKAFDACVNGGGRVRTMKPSKGTYKHVCFKGGKSVAGYVHRDKKKKGTKKK